MRKYLHTRLHVSFLTVVALTRTSLILKYPLVPLFTFMHHALVDSSSWCACVRYVAQFRACSALSGRFFTDGEEIFFSNGLPLGKEDLTEVLLSCLLFLILTLLVLMFLSMFLAHLEQFKSRERPCMLRVFLFCGGLHACINMKVFHEHWCAGCGDAITSGKMQVTPTVGNFKWHPTCLANYQASAAAATPAGSQDNATTTQPPLTPLVTANGGTAAAAVGVDPFDTDRKRCARTEAARAKFATAVGDRKAQRKAVLAAARAKAKALRTAAKKSIKTTTLEQEGQTSSSSLDPPIQQQQPPQTQQPSGLTAVGVQDAVTHLTSTSPDGGGGQGVDSSLDATLPAPRAPSPQGAPLQQNKYGRSASMPGGDGHQEGTRVERSMTTSSSSSSSKPARQVPTSSCRGNLEKQVSMTFIACAQFVVDSFLPYETLLHACVGS